MTIDDAVEEYLAAKRLLAHDTYVWYARFLDYFIHWANEHRLFNVEEVTAGHVAAFVSDCPTDSPNTRHARAQVVKGFLNWCAKDPEMGVRQVTVNRIEMPKVKQPKVELLTERDISRLLAACLKTSYPRRNQALINVLLDTGIRASECCYDGERPELETGLKMDELFLGRGDSYIRVDGKGGKSRTIGLGNVTVVTLRRYLTRERACGGCNSSYVFLSRDGSPLSVRMLQQMLAEIGEMAGVPNVHPHRFRHTFAVNQLLAGTSDLVLMQLMGHTTLEATKVYTRAMNQMQARRAAVSIVDRMNERRAR